MNCPDFRFLAFQPLFCFGTLNLPMATSRVIQRSLPTWNRLDSYFIIGLSRTLRTWVQFHGVHVRWGLPYAGMSLSDCYYNPEKVALNYDVYEYLAIFLKSRERSKKNEKQRMCVVERVLRRLAALPRCIHTARCTPAISLTRTANGLKSDHKKGEVNGRINLVVSSPSFLCIICGINIRNEPENLYLIVAVLESKEDTKVGSELFTCFFYGSTNSVGLAGPIIVLWGRS